MLLLSGSGLKPDNPECMRIYHAPEHVAMHEMALATVMSMSCPQSVSGMLQTMSFWVLYQGRQLLTAKRGAPMLAMSP